MSRFQLILTGALIVAGVAGALVFATSKSNNSVTSTPVVMWGTVSQTTISNFLSDVTATSPDLVNLTYVEKNPVSFETELIAALARGQGPDLVLLPQDLIVKQFDKFYPVPFSTYSERLFKDSFIQEGELYVTQSGIIGFPFSVDPLVMYWNRDIFANAGLATPPTGWADFFALVPKITKKDNAGNILQSLIAFGETKNVVHYKDVIALLSMQAGTPIISRDSQSRLSSFLATRSGSGLVPAEEAVSYYTEFSNPNKDSYSWNRSLPTDRSAFLAGRLAVYFGYASELPGLRAANPNLNFDVMMVPQTSGKRLTFGSMNAIAILRASPNLTAAYTAAINLTTAPVQQTWVNTSGLPPVRRDLLATLPGDAYKAVFWQSALISSAWLDPYREASNDVFARLIDNVTSGKMRVSESVSNASAELDALLRNSI